MRAGVAFATKEVVELAPVAAVGLVAGAALGGQSIFVEGMTIITAHILMVWAAVFGAWQGLLDRRFRANEFLRHRPGACEPAQLGRWIVGVSVIALMFLAYVGYQRIGAELMDPDDLLEGRRRMNLRRTDQFASWSILRWGVLFACTAWAALRVTVSWPGIVAPVLLTPIVVFSLGIVRQWAWGPLAGMLLFVLLSGSQIWTLGRPRLGGAS